jgi:hypothetical protein
MDSMSRVVLNPHLRRRFYGILDELWRRKLSSVFAAFTPSPGKHAKFTKTFREDRIEELDDLISEAYIPYFRRWVEKTAEKAQVKIPKRVECNNRAEWVATRLAKQYGRHKHLVYASFAGHKKCWKVGRSDRGLKRISSQADAYFFYHSNRVAVFYPRRRKKRVLPALECALTHIYDPRHLPKWPPLTKYLQKCPACRDIGLVRSIVRRMFPA